MSQLNKLYRNFIILQEDERGYESSNDKTLSGYSKVEAKGDVCKVSFYAQNLRSDDDYCGMIICSKKDTKKILNLGKITISESGKAEITKEYPIDDIAGLGVSYDKISGAAIGKMKNDVPIIIMCGFINSEEPSDNWKNYKVFKPSTGKSKDKMDYIKKDDKKKKEDKKDDKKKKCKEHREEEIQNEDSIIEEKIEFIESEDINDINCEDTRGEEVTSNNIEDILDNIQEVIDEVIEEEKYKVSNENPFENNTIRENPFGTGNNYETRSNKKNKFDEYEEEIEKKSHEFRIRGSVGEYFEGIANGFEWCRNKYDEIKYCKWYKVPVNDFNELCNMSNYNRYTVAYYPMLNYYPYIRQHGHFMMGYKCDEEGNLKYIVYGIPGKKNRDDQPYEGKTGFVTWVNNETRDGSGCWLMFYDFKNSTVVVPMK